MNDFEHKVMECKKDKNHPQRNELINSYVPFIIKNVSKTTGKYISCENSDEFIVGLEAFNEAIDKYDRSKGSFVNFAEIIISSRVKDFLKKENHYQKTTPLEEKEEFETYEVISDENDILKDEVHKFKGMLKLFSIDIEDLVEEAPKHKKTKEEVILLSKNASQDDIIVHRLYKTKKLPMAEMITKFNTTKKKMKDHRNFIIAVIIIFREKLSSMIYFAGLGGGKNV
ncbi:MAG: hypothetical protein A2Y24_03925 [Clostridiales bacterium GWE2_32_10]|nr:MAG: hypothetical protein A2Y24_03925 [Clostridiales bacterium GWE2_32_10]HBY21358.1 RNA polymerase subunit sigma [Clostridiales bacterium]